MKIGDTREVVCVLNRAAIGKATDDAILAMAHADRSVAAERASYTE